MKQALRWTTVCCGRCLKTIYARLYYYCPGQFPSMSYQDCPWVACRALRPGEGRPADEFLTLAPSVAPPTPVGRRDRGHRRRHRDGMPRPERRAGWDRPAAAGWRYVAT